MTPDDDPLGVEDSSNLTDADWAEINRWRQAYAIGGQKALSGVMEETSKSSPERYLTVLAAFFPDMVREAVKDSMAEIGMDEQDLRELVRKLESPAPDQ